MSGTSWRAGFLDDPISHSFECVVYDSDKYPENVLVIREEEYKIFKFSLNKKNKKHTALIPHEINTVFMQLSRTLAQPFVSTGFLLSFLDFMKNPSFFHGFYSSSQTFFYQVVESF